ncbi:MAG TPA: serine/threonine-protein kinase [Candidatus Acidoferrum sp.]|nr:serine/threonine-protein kinase [Candidatus Acidoferrum sp.]
MPEAQQFDYDTVTAPQPGPFGKYYLQELINSGGMADLWLATDSTGKHFALRKLRKTTAFDFVTRKRFLQGCEILSKIHDHEFVITYHEHGKIDGALYLLMEYVEGANLKQLYARTDEVLQQFVGNILIDMAVALEHVHDSGFMHLDFKPENVMVTRNGNVRLVDFDLAQPIPKEPIKLVKNPGTPAYMAPEQLLRQPIDHRVDIFSFGVSAYELLTGSKPYPGETPDEVLRQQLDPQFLTPPRTLNPEIPANLEKTILKCLERDPTRRHPIMTVAVRELESALYV